MEGLNRAVGAAVPFEWKGRQYALERFSIGDWAYLEECLLRRKRQAVVKQATDLKDVLDADSYRELLKEKIQQANAITEVSNDEVASLLAMDGGGDGGEDAGRATRDARGMAFFLSCILNRKYPGEFTEADILDLVASGTLGEAHMASFASGVMQLQGSSGNLTGRTEEGQPVRLSRAARRQRRRS